MRTKLVIKSDSLPRLGQARRPVRRRGSALVYGAVCMFALAGFAALAVDWGRVQLAKSELQSAADAASRYAAAGLQNDINGASAAYGNAAAVAAQNKADGQTISFRQNEDVELGVWTSATKTFVPTGNLNIANAVRVTMRCTSARGNPVPMSFLSVFGKKTSDVTASSIAMIDFSAALGGAGMGRYEYFIPATSNPWLSGMPSGAKANNGNPHNNPDYAGSNYVDDGISKLWDIGSAILNTSFTGRGTGDDILNLDVSQSNWSQWGNYSTKKGSPIQAGSITVAPGSTVTFDGVNGGANNDSSSAKYSGDGNVADVQSNYKGDENGISDIKAPMNSVIGVFLGADKPNKGGAPDELDFSTAAKRDYTTLAPELKQPFFIGDGRTSGGEVQRVVVPAGATRMFIGTMDSYEWNNNVGGFFVTAHATGRIVTVR